MTENNDNLLYITYESAMARMERANKRNFIIIIILILALIATNAGWIIYESQFETVETTIEAEQSGADVNIVGGGDIQYGAESNDQKHGQDNVKQAVTPDIVNAICVMAQVG